MIELSQCFFVLGGIFIIIDFIRIIYKIFLQRSFLLKASFSLIFQTIAVLIITVIIGIFFFYNTFKMTDIENYMFFFACFAYTVLITFFLEQMNSMESCSIELLEAIICATEAANPNLNGHAIQVMNLTMLLYEHLPINYAASINPSELQCAALLINIGKLGVSKNIINKSGKLEDDERTQMMRHPEIAQKMLRSIKSMNTISKWIKYLHENVDGTGYFHLKDDSIPLESRIIAIADTYSAIIMERSYKAALTHEDAIAELKLSSGKKLDADLVSIFCAIPLYKIDSCIACAKDKMQIYKEENFL